MSVLSNLILPLKYESGSIVDGSGKTIITAVRDSNETPLNPVGRDAIMHLTVELLNESFKYDQADIILKRLGY